jgi:hypothetical protein
VSVGLCHQDVYVRTLSYAMPIAQAENIRYSA